MDDDVKARFDDLDKRIAVTDKRFDDVKYFAGGVSLLLSILALIAGFNFSNERTWLRESMRDFKEETKKLEPTPALELVGTDGKDLSGQEIPGEVVTLEGTATLLFNFVAKNIGQGSTGPIWVKLYTSDPLVLHGRSSDEPKYKYEAIMWPELFRPSELPGNITSGRWLRVALATKSIVPAGKYGVLMKHYYGKGRIVTAGFTIAISQ